MKISGLENNLLSSISAVPFFKFRLGINKIRQKGKICKFRAVSTTSLLKAKQRNSKEVSIQSFYYTEAKLCFATLAPTEYYRTDRLNKTNF